MRPLRFFALLSAGCMSLALLLVAQQGPTTKNGDTVARPKKGNAPAPKEAEMPPLPSVFKRDKGLPPEGGEPTFRVDAATVTLDVAVIDSEEIGRAHV